MTIDENSYLRLPPKKLNAKQTSIFNAITYSIDICDLSYNRLYSKLSIFEDKLHYDKTLYSEIFCDAWSIINSSTIFLNLISRHFNEADNSTLIEIKKAKKIRNTNQHLDERVEEVFMLKNLPIYGSLSWRHNLPNSNLCNLNILSAGSFTHHDGLKISISPGKSSGKEIENIMLNSIERKGNNFDVLSVCLDKLIEELREFILRLESVFTKQIESKEGKKNVERHGTNMIFSLQGILVNDLET
ncbi:hypothetical protein [Flavobacterium sp. XGLA_31]|uniref:hypothetical protein n=1 Tax=Flavobacterium sp. XGLA_31 TaxID=3447666 RepID=UPI003F37DC19